MRATLLAICLVNPSIVAAAVPGQGVPYPNALTRAAVAVGTLDEPPNDSLLLGNGDLNGLLLADGNDLVLTVTKNDVWDARLDTRLDAPLPTLSRLKELAKGDWPDRKLVLPEGSTWKGPDSYNAHSYPCPRACGRVRIAGAAGRSLVAKLDLARGMAEVHSQGISCQVFVAADSNAIVITTHPDTEIGIEPIRSNEIPAADEGEAAGTEWITQRIPGDDDWPGMTFALACRRQAGRTAIAVVTSIEADDPRQAAIRLAETTLTRNAAGLERAHVNAWQSFWCASGIEIGDRLLERVWYRSLYLLRCVSKPGVVSTGLFAGLLDDKPAWHGDYHTNYNIQQTYWSAYATNHCDLAEPYDRLISDYLPRARWLARRIYNCDGAFFPHVLYAYEPPDPARCKSPNGRQYIHHVWGWTLGVSGFSVQPLWWRYKYEPSRGYLSNVAYPALRDVADFYAAFIEQCEPDGDHVVLGPTMSPEHYGWTPNFEKNRNCTFDIALFHFVFDAAIEGANTLQTDRAKRERWQAAKRRLPPYPRHAGPPEVVVDVADVPMKEIFNIPVPVTPVFPGDQIDRRSPESVQALFRRTLEHVKVNGNNSTVILGTTRARLALPDALDWLHTELERRERPNGTLTLNRREPHHRFNDFGHYTEMAGAALPITELLLQSVGDCLRLFPAWPRSRPASFANLRAWGGFLVSAELGKNGQVASLRIRSTAGRDLALMSPWKNAEFRTDGSTAWQPAAQDAKGIIRLPTKPRQTLEFRARRP